VVLFAVPDLDQHLDLLERHTPRPGLKGQIVRWTASSLPKRLAGIPVERFTEPLRLGLPCQRPRRCAGGEQRVRSRLTFQATLAKKRWIATAPSRESVQPPVVRAPVARAPADQTSRSTRFVRPDAGRATPRHRRRRTCLHRTRR
jgi:hypothetical protein